MRKLMLSIIFAIGFAPLSLAQQSTSVAGVEAEKSAEESASPKSAQIREGQKFKVAARTGLMYTLIPGIGIEGDYLLSSKLQVGASVNGGRLKAKAEADGRSSEFNDDDDDDDEDADDKTNLDHADLRASSIAGHARYFPLNSLYVLGGMSYRAVSTKVDVSNADDESSFISTTTNARAVCLDVGIGNEWSFESGFFIGAEWFGISTPVWAKSDTDTTEQGTPNDGTEDETDGARKFAESVGKGTSVRLAMLHLGWAF